MTRRRDTAPPRTAYTVPEIANSLGLSKRQVERLVACGDLPSKKIGGRRLVLVRDFERFVEAAS